MPQDYLLWCVVQLKAEEQRKEYTMADNNKEKWEEKLRALMAKAEDSATTEAERDVIVSRVTYLMAKFGIEEAMLKSRDAEPEVVTSIRIRIENPYCDQRIHLLDHIGRTFGCKSIILEKPMRGGQKHAVLRMFGYDGDLQRSYLLFGSLIIQMFSGLAAASAGKPAHIHGRTFNNSFVTGYVDTLIDRVETAYRRAKEEVKAESTGNGMELVLASRFDSVKNAFKTEYPHTTMSNYNPSNRSYEGFSAGQSAGRRADIGQTGVAGGRVAIGS